MTDLTDDTMDDPMLRLLRGQEVATLTLAAAVLLVNHSPAAAVDEVLRLRWRVRQRLEEAATG